LLKASAMPCSFYAKADRLTPPNRVLGTIECFVVVGLCLEFNRMSHLPLLATLMAGVFLLAAFGARAESKPFGIERRVLWAVTLIRGWITQLPR
jgi:hypothetical protein